MSISYYEPKSIVNTKQILNSSCDTIHLSYQLLSPLTAIKTTKRCNTYSPSVLSNHCNKRCDKSNKVIISLNIHEYNCVLVIVTLDIDLWLAIARSCDAFVWPPVVASVRQTCRTSLSLQCLMLYLHVCCNQFVNTFKQSCGPQLHVYVWYFARQLHCGRHHIHTLATTMAIVCQNNSNQLRHTCCPSRKICVRAVRVNKKWDD